MAEHNLMKPSDATMKDLLGNGKIYRVPTFQRDYSWKEENWEDLWLDIQSVQKNDSDHYMGSIVLQNKGSKNYTVIDGQQRLTTLSLFALSVIKAIQDIADKNIERDENLERINRLRALFLGDKDPGSLIYSSKLFLNENNDSFYQTYLLQLRQPINEKSLPDSDKLMWEAFKFFYGQINKQFKDNSSGQILADFLNKTVAERLLFIQIIVENELSAYTLFETLNYRGVDLTVTDLLKNYLFSLLQEAELRAAKEQWKKIIMAIGLEKFPVFLRHYWISKNNLIRQEQLFKVLRIEVKNNFGVFNLLDELEKASDIYNALRDPLHTEWRGDRGRMKKIRELRLFDVKQCLPVLMAAKMNFTEDEFNKMLRLIVVISFRYNVIGSKHTNVLEEYYNKASVKISQKHILATAQVFHELKSLYVPDKDFKNDFSTIQFSTKNSRSKKMARYILFELENHLAQSDRDWEADFANIEHILPENAPDTWLPFFPSSVQENFIYRLGNYTLLEEDKNRDAGVKNFSQKKAIYSTSQYEMPKRIGGEEWSPVTLDLRQQKMGDWAAAIWRVTYADQPKH